MIVDDAPHSARRPTIRVHSTELGFGIHACAVRKLRTPVVLDTNNRDPRPTKKGSVAVAERIFGAPVVQVIGVSVGHDDGLRMSSQKRSVRLISFQNEPVRIVRPSNATAKSSDCAADEKRWRLPGIHEQRGQHRRRRGLPMRTGNSEYPFRSTNRLHRVAARKTRNTLAPSGGEFDVARRNRGRVDHERGTVDMFRVVTYGDLEPLGPQGSHGRRIGLVTPTYLVAALVEDCGDRTHRRATDCDDMYTYR